MGGGNYLSLDEKRVNALVLAEGVGTLLLETDEAAAQFLGKERVTNVVDFVTLTQKAVALIDQGLEPHLIVATALDPNSFTSIPVYDYGKDAVEEGTGLVWIDLSVGEVLIRGNALLKWR